MIKNFEQYKLNEEIQSIDFDLIYHDINEGKKFNFYRNVLSKVLKDFNLNLYYTGTFGTALAVLIPTIESLVRNLEPHLQIDTYQIALLVVFCTTEVLNVNNDRIKILKEKIKENGLSHLIKHIKGTLLSIHKIFNVVGESIGKTASLFIDMLGYVAIFVPILAVLQELSTQEGLNIETLPNKILSLGVGVGAFALKNIATAVIKKLKNRQQNINKSKIQS